MAVAVSDFIEGLTPGTGAKTKGQYLETIREIFAKNLERQTFLGMAEKVPFKQYQGNIIMQNRLDAMKRVTLPLNNKYSDGQTLNRQTISAKNIELEYWLYGSFVEYTKWLKMTQDNKIEPITFVNISKNGVESVEAITREYLVKGAKVFSDKDTFTFAGCPCSLWRGVGGSVAAGSLTTANGIPNLADIIDITTDIKMKNGQDVTVVMSQYQANYLAMNDTNWKNFMNAIYNGQKNGSPIKTGRFDVDYMGCHFQIMQDYIGENIGIEETPIIVEDMFIMAKGAYRVTDSYNSFDVNVVGFDKKDLSDIYNLTKGVSWQVPFGIATVNSTMIYKIQTMYTGMPATATIFDELNV